MRRRLADPSASNANMLEFSSWHGARCLYLMLMIYSEAWLVATTRPQCQVDQPLSESVVSQLTLKVSYRQVCGRPSESCSSVDVEVGRHPLKTDSFGIFSFSALATAARGHCRRRTIVYSSTGRCSAGDRTWCIFVSYVATQEHDKLLGLVDHEVMSVSSSRGARSI